MKLTSLVRMMGRILLAGALLCVSPVGGATVVVYVSEDQVFSEPILKGFERETGIKIKAVYDPRKRRVPAS